MEHSSFRQVIFLSICPASWSRVVVWVKGREVTLTFIKRIVGNLNTPSVAASCLILDLGVVQSSNTLHSSFPFLVLYHPVLVSGRMELSSSACHGLSLKWVPLKTYFSQHQRVFFLWLNDHPRCPSWTLDFAVFSPRFEPTIHFSDWSAVSPSKSRDLPLHEPAIPFYHLVSGFPSSMTSFPVEPAIPLATMSQRLHFRLATTRTNQKPDQGVCMQINVGKFAMWAPFTTFITIFLPPTDLAGTHTSLLPHKIR